MQMQNFNFISMDKLDKLIKGTGTEKTSDRFTYTVMEKIRTLPVPETASPLKISLWFKILMVGLFSGSMILPIFYTGNDPGTGNIMIEYINQGIRYFNGLLSVIPTWINLHLWLIPYFLFSVMGILYLIIFRMFFIYDT